jgi:multisubunit Na+/H+ antiporter MnhG subunit
MRTVVSESLRRLWVMVLLMVSMMLFFYTPHEIYHITIKSYAKEYQQKVQWGWIDPQTHSLEAYIQQSMRTSPWRKSSTKPLQSIKTPQERAFFQALLDAPKNPQLNQHRSKQRHLYDERSYYFYAHSLPSTLLQKPLEGIVYYTLTQASGTKRYFTLHKASRGFMLDDASQALRYPYRFYSYLLWLFALLGYLLIPKPAIPKHAAYFRKLNAVYMPDILGFGLWSMAWFLYFLPDDSVPMAVKLILLLFFLLFALAILLPIVKYASNWYLFEEDGLRYSSIKGIQTISFEEIVSIEPYSRRLPKWVAPLIILLGRGNIGAIGLGLITASSASEIGMEITLNSGKRLRIMANYLQSDTQFTQRFQALKEAIDQKHTGG